MKEYTTPIQGKKQKQLHIYCQAKLYKTQTQSFELIYINEQKTD